MRSILGEAVRSRKRQLKQPLLGEGDGLPWDQLTLFPDVFQEENPGSLVKIHRFVRLVNVAGCPVW